MTEHSFTFMLELQNLLTLYAMGALSQVVTPSTVTSMVSDAVVRVRHVVLMSIFCLDKDCSCRDGINIHVEGSLSVMFSVSSLPNRFTHPALRFKHFKAAPLKYVFVSTFIKFINSELSMMFPSQLSPGQSNHVIVEALFFPLPIGL